MARSVRSIRLAVLCAATLMTGVVAATPGLAAPSQPGQPSVRHDVRSGAALNRDAALAQLNVTPDQAVGAPPRFSTLALVNDPAADRTVRDTQSETTIAVAGRDLVSAYNDSGSFIDRKFHFTGYSTSRDGGRTWQDRGTLPDSNEGDGGDPVLATDTRTGRVYLVTLGFKTGTNLQLFRSDDSGRTFAAPVNATPGFGGTQSFQDKPWMAVDNFPGGGRGNVYIGWRQFGGPGEGMKFTRSTDGGETWGPKRGTTVLPRDGQGAYVVVTPDHCVHYFYLSTVENGANDTRIKVRTSCDQGLTFGPATLVTDLRTNGDNGDLNLNGGLRSNAFPQVAVNPGTGALYATYSDLSGAGKADVFLRTSTDGLTWSAPVRVNTDSTRTDQFFPTVAVTDTGRALLVGWYDRRNDPANYDLQRYSRLATINPTTGTPTFGVDFPLSPSFPVVIGQDPVVNPTYMGDYDQIAAGRDQFFSTWGDNRLRDAFNANQPDVRFARLGDDGTVQVVG